MADPEEQQLMVPEKRAENLTRLMGKVRALHDLASESPTADDLTRVQYVVARRQADDGLRDALADWKRINSAHLEVPIEEIAILIEKPSGPYVMALLRLIGQQLAAHPDVEFGGATPGNPPEWRRVQIGDSFEVIPEWINIYWDPGTVAEPPLVLGTWMHNGQRIVVVRSRVQDQVEAQTYLASLLTKARGAANPYRGRLLKASLDMHRGGLTFDVLPDPTDARESLVLAPAIWKALDYNVHRMFDRMETFHRAGLGSNRGVLLGGAPGTGKTAACKVLAREVLGCATPIFVQAQVGQHLLRQLYETLEGLGPVLVLLEDLDLLVGGRESGTAREAVFDFLAVLDGLMTQHHEVVTVATTNDPGAIDAAVRRAARFDQIIMFPFPDEDARARILEVYLSAVENQVDTAMVARATEDHTGADLREYVRGALLRADGPVTTEDLLSMVARVGALPVEALDVDRTDAARYL